MPYILSPRGKVTGWEISIDPVSEIGQVCIICGVELFHWGMHGRFSFSSAQLAAQVAPEEYLCLKCLGKAVLEFLARQSGE